MALKQRTLYLVLFCSGQLICSSASKKDPWPAYPKLSSIDQYLIATALNTAREQNLTAKTSRSSLFAHRSDENPNVYYHVEIGTEDTTVKVIEEITAQSKIFMRAAQHDFSIALKQGPSLPCAPFKSYKNSYASVSVGLGNEQDMYFFLAKLIMPTLTFFSYATPISPMRPTPPSNKPKTVVFHRRKNFKLIGSNQ